MPKTISNHLPGQLMSQSVDTSRPSKSTLSFVGWTASIFVYVCFAAWALLPERTLHGLGITYYPSRYYAVALPAYVLVVYLLSGIVYIGLNLLNTCDPEEIATMRDVRPLAGATLSAPLTFVKCGSIGTKDYSGIPEIGDIDPVQLSVILCK
jgi:hypothetical protein